MLRIARHGTARLGVLGLAGGARLGKAWSFISSGTGVRLGQVHHLVTARKARRGRGQAWLGRARRGKARGLAR